MTSKLIYDDIENLDDRVIRASAFGDVDSGLIPSRVKPMTIKLVFTASLFDVLDPCRCGRQMAGNS